VQIFCVVARSGKLYFVRTLKAERAVSFITENGETVAACSPVISEPVGAAVFEL